MAIPPGVWIEPCGGLRPAVAATISISRRPDEKEDIRVRNERIVARNHRLGTRQRKGRGSSEECQHVLTEILNIPDDIPQDLLDKADCVVVFPSVLKAAFVVGGSYGRGAMTGENFNGPWGAPSMMALEGGSVGFQIGGQATDFVLLVMNDRGANGILSSKVKPGGERRWQQDQSVVTRRQKPMSRCGLKY